MYSNKCCYIASDPFYKTQLSNSSKLKKMINLIDNNKFILNLYIFFKFYVVNTLLSSNYLSIYFLSSFN